MEYRVEKDSMGEMKVPADKYWGAQTQRSHENFVIGTDRVPIEVTHALAQLKKACAIVNNNIGKLDDERKALIVDACDKIISGDLDDNFPLVVYQTGSGTQSNMNVNEVVSGYVNAKKGERIIHPNDHVNMSQSSNDTFPTAMHIAAVTEINERLLPAIDGLIKTFKAKEEEYSDIIKIGRTHLQDATPIKFSQEVSGWRNMLEITRAMIVEATEKLTYLAIGGTAVGTGLNAPENFGKKVSAVIAENTGFPFKSAPNKFHALTSKDEIVYAHGALKALACNLLKIANDVRFLACGPRCGFSEISIPANEPGSSIMPGKVNPTQCEAMTMVAVQVMGNDTTITVGASQGNFELNVYMPVLIFNFLQSVRLLSDTLNSFNDKCAKGIVANRDRMDSLLHNSLMLVTALSPKTGYDNAAKIAKYAHEKNLTLKEAAKELGFLTEEEFDKYVKPEMMV